MNFHSFLSHFDKRRIIAVGALAVFTAGVLCVTTMRSARIEAELAVEAAEWELEMARIEAEEAARLEAEQAAREELTIGRIALTSGGQALAATGYLPQKLGGEEQESDLAAAVDALQPGVLAEDAEVVLELPDTVPASIVIWRDPVGDETPAESVNYTREETDGGVRCIFNVHFGDYTTVDYQLDVKLDDDNHGRIGFEVIRG